MLCRQQLNDQFLTLLCIFFNPAEIFSYPRRDNRQEYSAILYSAYSPMGTPDAELLDPAGSGSKPDTKALDAEPDPNPA